MINTGNVHVLAIAHVQPVFTKVNEDIFSISMTFSKRSVNFNFRFMIKRILD